MKGDLRCVEGRLWRHDPQFDDPDLETDIGECPDCSGDGCGEEGEADRGDASGPGSRPSGEAPGGSSASPSIPIATPFHELSEEMFKALCDAGITWRQISAIHPQPSWCNYPDALNGIAGCWSLVGGKVTGEGFCMECECHSSVGNADAPHG